MNHAPVHPSSDNAPLGDSLGWLGAASMGLMLAAAFTLATVGCASSNSGSPIALEAPGPWAGELSIEVENDLGEVSIQVDPSLAAPVVGIRRFGEFEGNTIDLAEGLTVTRLGGTSGQTLKVVARPVVYPAAASFLKAKRRALSIDIRTPTVFGVIVRNAGGSVMLTGVGGPIQVNNGIADRRAIVNGLDFTDLARVVVRTDRPLREPIDITSGQGGISFEIPEDSDLNLAVAGAKGKTIVHAPAAAFAEVRNDPSAWSARLGDGSVPAQLKAGGGPVEIEVTRVKNRRPPR